MVIVHTALLLVVLVSESLTADHAGTAGGSQSLDQDQQLGRDVLRELIEINTTLHAGSGKAARAMAARLLAAGFPKGDVQLVGPQTQHLNLVVRYRGTGVQRPLLFIAHLDVVEALRKDWSVDPFSFLEKDGYFYGRGTTDDKCDDAALITNLLRLKKEGYVPNRDIIVALTEDEENGDANGVQWLLRNHRPLIDAEYCINGDGGAGEIKNGRHSILEFQTSEKTYADYQLEATNKGGHSSLPVKENAIYRLAEALTRIAGFEFPIRLNETTRMFFERSASHESGQTRTDMLAIAATPSDTVAAARLARSSAYYNALMRTTWVATMLSGGHAENALPQSARAVINCRLLPDDSPDSVMSTLRSVVADPHIIISRLNKPSAGPLSPVRADLMAHVEKVAAVLWPQVVVTPVMSTGGTDGKSLRIAGIPVYGISGMFTDIDDVRAHGRDERIGVREFYEGIEFAYMLIKALTSGS
jgi:acetylornithine deacetylase/succinyl-diaminopimelate desuccinylase-like protein